MLNSGAPGVMLDLEDSMANEWEHQGVGVENVLQALRGTLTYFDKKRNKVVGIEPKPTVIWTRPRGLHIHQGGIFGEELTSASLFDVASIVWRIDPAELKHPLSFYIPKSESAEEALWWRDLFQALAAARGWPRDYIKCMALVESHPLAFQMEEFLYNLRDHILGLNLGRWDYMASLIHFNLDDPEWVLPDRNTIPSNVPFFQNLRELMPEICHKRGVLAIGGMTALFPSREDSELNARALAGLEKDKKNEANCLMDGAWTGHPDQNQIAIDQFPFPNQLQARRAQAERYPNLRPVPQRCGRAHAGRNASGGADCDPLSQRRVERQRRQPAGWIYGGSGDRPHLPADDRAALAAQRACARDRRWKDRGAHAGTGFSFVRRRAGKAGGESGARLGNGGHVSRGAPDQRSDDFER